LLGENGYPLDVWIFEPGLEPRRFSDQVVGDETLERFQYLHPDVIEMPISIPGL
jgi:hypothetical protein